MTSGWSQRMIRCYTVNLSSLSLSLSLWLTVRIFSRDWSTADKCFLAAPRFSSGNDSSSYRSPQDGIVEPLEQALSGEPGVVIHSLTASSGQGITTHGYTSVSEGSFQRFRRLTSRNSVQPKPGICPLTPFHTGSSRNH